MSEGDGQDPVDARRLEAVAMHGAEPSPTRLAALLADEDWRVRKEAADVAALWIARSEVLGLLVEGVLAPDDVGLRNAAVEAFVRAPDEAAPAVATALVGALRGAPRTSRKFVAAALVGAGQGALAPLTELARDEDVMTASCALEALAALARRGVAGVAVAALLVETLRRDEAVLRLAALDGLIALGAEVDASVLGPLLGDAITRPSALRLLARARTEVGADGIDDVARLLLEMMMLPASTVEAALALARRSDPELPRERRSLVGPQCTEALARTVASLGEGARSALAAALSSRALVDARSIARLLLEGRALALLPAIVELGSRAELDPPCREALVALGDRAVAPLLEVVRARRLDDVRAAAWALEAASDLAGLSASNPSIEDELRDLARGLLGQGEEVGARAAAVTLARWGDAADARALATRVGAYGTTYEAAAAHAVEQIAARSPVDVRASLPERVGRRSLAPAAPRGLRAQLASDDPVVRAEALEGVRTIVDAEALELVSLCLTDEDERVEVAAVRALKGVRGAELSEAAIQVVRVAARSELASVRAQAIETLAQLGAFLRGADALLLESLRDSSPRVVIAALRALAAIESMDPRVDEALDALLAHSDAEIVKEVLVVSPAAAGPSLDRLARALDHEHWSVRARAAEVLGRLLVVSTGQPDVTSAARAALARRRVVETDELVQRALAQSLAEGG